MLIFIYVYIYMSIEHDIVHTLHIYIYRRGNYVTTNVVIFPTMWGPTVTSRLIVTHPNANILSQKIPKNPSVGVVVNQVTYVYRAPLYRTFFFIESDGEILILTMAMMMYVEDEDDNHSFCSHLALLLSSPIKSLQTSHGPSLFGTRAE